MSLHEAISVMAARSSRTSSGRSDVQLKRRNKSFLRWRRFAAVSRHLLEQYRPRDSNPEYVFPQVAHFLPVSFLRRLYFAPFFGPGLTS
jgi:hypothetical protein